MQNADKNMIDLWLMSSEIVMYVEKKIKPLGLTIHDVRALIILDKQGDLSPGDLASALGVTNGAVTGIVNRLLAVGAATRTQTGLDKRRRQITITYSDLDTVLMDFATDTRHLFNSYSARDLAVIEQYHQDISELLDKAKNDIGEAAGLNQRK